MKESRTLELKREVTRTFLKTVSAFANFGSGKIIFGIDDDGTVIGIDEPVKTCLTIENMINDSISPMPTFLLDVSKKDNKEIITLSVDEGPDKPYLYKAKAYRRSDTADIEVEPVELKRLILEGQNLSFEEARSHSQELSFDCLRHDFAERVGVETIDKPILKTLRLYSDKSGYNNAAAILADDNDFFGTDIARFGQTQDVILDRRRFAGVSALKQFHEALEMFKTYYQFEKIEGATRNLHERIPYEAFREALANALVHRQWDVSANIQVSFFEDGIKISSPGGLPASISEKEYLDGAISVLRNPILGNVFLRLDYMELYGTGIKRIRNAYKHTSVEPIFEVSDNWLYVTLPVIDQLEYLTTDEQKVYNALSPNIACSRTEIEGATSFNKAKVGRVLNRLIDKNKAIKLGNGVSTKYLRN